MIKRILEKANEPMKPSFVVPAYNWVKYPTNIWLYEQVPKRLITEKIGEIDFQNELDYLFITGNPVLERIMKNTVRHTMFRT